MYESIEMLRRKTSPIPDGRYLMGLSGGADSVAMLMMLIPSVREGRIILEAIHVNHGLRGTESDRDEQFCRELCKEERIPLSVYRAELHDRTDEASAREARFSFFRKRFTEYGADALLLAHQADDQAETFMMRLIRGAGPDGLGCMKEEETLSGIRILRPMLALGRDEIRSALRADGIRWCEDSSNTDTAYLRNRIRAELFPTLNSISGTVTKKICQAAAMIAGDSEVLNTQAEMILSRVSKGMMINAEELAGVPDALRRRVLRKWWKDQAPGLHERALNLRQTEALEGLLRVHRGKINLPGGMHAVRDGKYLFAAGARRHPPQPVKITGPETVFGSFRLTESASEGEPGDGKKTQEVPEGFARGCEIRTRRPGDRIRPFGSSGSRKLQDYLTDRRIAEPFRDQIPLLCRDGEVLLVAGVGAGNIPRWNSEHPHIRLSWQGEMPWME